MPDRPHLLSLYAGAGGLDAGFVAAGYRPVWANERDPYAVATRRDVLNAVSPGCDTDEIVVTGDLDLSTLPSRGDVDIVVGGPPCQGFSVAGKRDPDDPRSTQVHRFLDVVERLSPAAFVMENVPALAEGERWREHREALVRRARELGYWTTLCVLNAADFGVPQSRRRMFLLGSRMRVPVAPAATCSRPMTVREAFSTLPRAGDPGNDLLCSARITAAKTPVLRVSPYAGMLFNGSGRPLNPDLPALTLPASMGGNRTPIVDQANLDDPSLPLWVPSYHEWLCDGGTPVREVPARMRRVTVAEAATLQGFPKDVTWHGPRTAQYRQIGNAVPPPLARAVAAGMRDRV